MIVKNITKDEIVNFNIPTGIPMVFEIDSKMKILKNYFVGDKNLIAKKIKQVKNQISI